MTGSWGQQLVDDGDFEVRLAEEKDYKEIAEIHVKAWQVGYKGIMPSDFLDKLSLKEKEENWQKILSGAETKGTYLVYESKGKVIAFAVYGPARDDDLSSQDAELVALNVHPSEWRQGIGKTLLSKVTDRVLEEGYGNLYLWVASKNQKAINLYSNYGFNPDGKEKSDSSHTGSPLEEHRLIKVLS